VTIIRKDSFDGAANIDQSSGTEPTLAETLRDIAGDLVSMKAEAMIANANLLVTDITDSRTKFIAALTALDGDTGVTDTNYVATQSPAALTVASITNSANLVALLNAGNVDLAALRAKMITLLAKLDADTLVGDTNYAALWTPAALTGATITTQAQAATQFKALVADRAALRATWAGILAKLDADSGVTLTTYLATHAAAAPTTIAVAALATIAA
jgi:hypothetical protein